LPYKLVEAIGVLGGSKIKEFMDVALRNRELLSKVHPVSPKPGKEANFRKLASFPDKENKVRVIGILDYFSQSVLKPFHLYLYRALRKIPQDCTQDQGTFKKALEGSEIYYSIDLTAATDRFPIAVISQLLRGHLPI
jgi:hypothetical protein